MARIHYRAVIQSISSSAGISALTTATVNVYQSGTFTPVAFSLWSDPVLSNAATNPLTLNNAIAEFWIDSPQSFDLYITNSGYPDARIPLSLDFENSFGASDGSSTDARTIRLVATGVTSPTGDISGSAGDLIAGDDA